MKQNNKQQAVVKVMDIIGEVLPEEGFTPNKCHRRIKIAGGRGVKWPRGLKKRLYLFGIERSVREKLIPGEIVCITQVREIKEGKHRCLAVTKSTEITILQVAVNKNAILSSASHLPEAVK